MDAEEWLADQGLVCVTFSEQENASRKSAEIYIIRPAHVGGTPFPPEHWKGYCRIGNTTVKANAPVALISKKESRRHKTWIADISMPAAPGPGPVWFHEEYGTLQEGCEAI